MSDQPANNFQVHPIGYVRQGDQGFYLEILEPYRPALKGLDQFSHVQVFWWFHQHDDETFRSILEAELPYAPSGTIFGMFACRGPVRPNLIGLTTCGVLKVDLKNGIVVIPWIDAQPDTPILDLKPYEPSMDRVRDVRVPNWAENWPKWVEDSGDFDWESIGLGE